MDEIDSFETLPGGDDLARVFIKEGKVLRSYPPEEITEALRILQKLSGEGFSKLGVVNTIIFELKPNQSLTLEHDPATFSLPQYWCIEQLRDALLHTIDVWRHVSEFELTLKDLLPENIGFSKSSPVFLDFPSIVATSSLEKIDWLRIERGKNSPQEYLLSTMMRRFFLIPLYVGYFGSQTKMRELLRENYCNSLNPAPSQQEIPRPGIRKFKLISLWFRVNFFLRWFGQGKKPLDHFNSLRNITEVVNRVLIQGQSSYSSYYEEKSENFAMDDSLSWKEKQLSVARILKDEVPKTVLDIGANTGWYSKLAAKEGAKVTAMDIDAVSIGELYEESKKNNLSLDAFVMSFEDLISISRMNDVFKIPTSGRLLPQSVFRYDLVLSLGLIHHLCLGSGYALQDIFKLLARLTSKCLVVEFIDLDDEKITGEVEFFRNFEKARPGYSLNALLEAGRFYFKYSETYESNPSTRKIIKFWND